MEHWKLTSAIVGGILLLVWVIRVVKNNIKIADAEQEQEWQESCRLRKVLVGKKMIVVIRQKKDSGKRCSNESRLIGYLVKTGVIIKVVPVERSTQIWKYEFDGLVVETELILVGTTEDYEARSYSISHRIDYRLLDGNGDHVLGSGVLQSDSWDRLNYLLTDAVARAVEKAA